MTVSTIADRIKLIMEREQLTVRELAERLDVQRSGLSHVFNGRNKPSLDLVTRIVRAFPEVSHEWLITGKQRAVSPERAGKEVADDQSQSDTNVISPDTYSDTEISDKEDEALFVRDTDVSLRKKQVGEEVKGKKTSELNKVIKRVIILYDDGSFEYYDK